MRSLQRVSADLERTHLIRLDNVLRICLRLCDLGWADELLAHGWYRIGAVNSIPNLLSSRPEVDRLAPLTDEGKLLLLNTI